MTPDQIFQILLTGKKVTLTVESQQQLTCLLGALRTTKSRNNKRLVGLGLAEVTDIIRSKRVTSEDESSNVFPAQIILWLGTSPKQKYSYNIVDIS